MKSQEAVPMRRYSFTVWEFKAPHPVLGQQKIQIRRNFFFIWEFTIWNCGQEDPATAFQCRDWPSVPATAFQCPRLAFNAATTFQRRDRLSMPAHAAATFNNSLFLLRSSSAGDCKPGKLPELSCLLRYDRNFCIPKPWPRSFRIPALFQCCWAVRGIFLRGVFQSRQRLWT